jgi:hypothetical protein
MVDCLALLLRTREILGLKIGHDTGYTEVFRSLSRQIQGLYLKLVHNLFPLHPSQFSIH